MNPKYFIPRYFIPPEFVAQLTDDEIRYVFQLIEESDHSRSTKKIATNSLYGATGWG